MTDALREEHDTLQRAIKASRHRAAVSDSAFVRAMQEVMIDYLAARADGLSAADAVRGIEAELRSRWAHPPSQFPAACDWCDDTGWQPVICTDARRCGRRRCAVNPAFEHRYVVPCSCPKGDGPGGRRRPTVEDAVIEAAMRRKRIPPRKGFSRLGSGS